MPYLTLARAAVLGLVVLSMARSTVLAGEVGEYSDPARLEIRDSKTFSAEEIKRELVGIFTVRLAAHPAADLLEYIESLKKHIQAGYRKAGFPETQVHGELDLDSHRIVLRIDEGPRYMVGDVSVKGAKTIPSEQLIERLTTPQPPKDAVAQSFQQQDGRTTIQWVDQDGKEAPLEPAVWRRGKPASFDAWAVSPIDRFSASGRNSTPGAKSPSASIRNATAAALADLGYYYPAFEVYLAPPPNSAPKREGNPVSLVIQIKDEGPPGVLGEIEVTGAKINSREDILNYLELKSGTVLTRDEMVRIKQRLWESARFIKHNVTPLKPACPTDKLMLRIDVLEYSKAPPLSQSLSPEEQVLLKLRDWLADSRHWPGDLVMKVVCPDGTLEAVVSSREGLYVSMERSEKGVAVVQGNRAAVFSRDGIGIYSPGEGRKFVAPPFGSAVAFGLRLSLTEDFKHPTNLAFSLETRSCDDAASPPFRLTLDMQPAFFLALAHENDAKTDLREGVLTVHAKENEIWCVDAATGRLVELRRSWPYEDVMSLADGKNPKQTPAAEKIANVRVSFETDAFARRVAELHRATAQHSNSFVPGHPLGSFLAFLADDLDICALAESKLGSPQRWLAVRKMLRGPLLDPIDARLTAPDRKTPFVIPAAPGQLEKYAVTNPRAWACGVFTHADKMFPRSSWPCTVAREASLVVLGKGDRAGQECQRLINSPETGPLCLLVLGTLAERVDRKLAARCAERGLQKLSREAMLRDCRPLADPDCLAGQSLQQVADVIRTLDEDDLRQCTEGLQEPLAACRARLIAYSAWNWTGRCIRHCRNSSRLCGGPASRCPSNRRSKTFSPALPPSNRSQNHEIAIARHLGHCHVHRIFRFRRRCSAEAVRGLSHRPRPEGRRQNHHRVGREVQAGPDGFGELLRSLGALLVRSERHARETREILQVHPKGNPENPLRGVFATRAPFRPNLIAMSRCKIKSIKENVIEIDEIDAFADSPVLDLKP